MYGRWKGTWMMSWKGKKYSMIITKWWLMFSQGRRNLYLNDSRSRSVFFLLERGIHFFHSFSSFLEFIILSCLLSCFWWIIKLWKIISFFWFFNASLETCSVVYTLWQPRITLASRSRMASSFMRVVPASRKYRQRKWFHGWSNNKCNPDRRRETINFIPTLENIGVYMHIYRFSPENKIEF